MIKNYLEAKRQPSEGSHNGTGPYDLYEIWGESDFKSNVDFMDRVVIPPNSTVGEHKHSDNEEMYIILSGAGKMLIEGKEVQIKKAI